MESTLIEDNPISMESAQAKLDNEMTVDSGPNPEADVPMQDLT